MKSYSKRQPNVVLDVVFHTADLLDTGQLSLLISSMPEQVIPLLFLYHSTFTWFVYFEVIYNSRKKSMGSICTCLQCCYLNEDYKQTLVVDNPFIFTNSKSYSVSGSSGRNSKKF